MEGKGAGFQESRREDILAGFLKSPFHLAIYMLLLLRCDLLNRFLCVRIKATMPVTVA
jgi:hypothetical protein